MDKNYISWMKRHIEAAIEKTDVVFADKLAEKLNNYMIAGMKGEDAGEKFAAATVPDVEGQVVLPGC